MAMMAGMAYCVNSFPMGFVPSSVAVSFCAIVLFVKNCAKLRFFRQKEKFVYLCGFKNAIG